MTSAPSSGTLIAILPCNDLDASERFYNRLGFVRRVESGDPDYRILSNGAGGQEIHSAFISISKMSTVWPLRHRTYAREDADQRTSPGECMNLQFLTQMRRLCASVGRVASDKQPTANQSEVVRYLRGRQTTRSSTLRPDLGGSGHAPTTRHPRLRRNDP